MIGDAHEHDEYAVIRTRGTGLRPVCGRWSVRGVNATETRYHRVNCGCWNCSYCGPRKAGRYRHAIRTQAEKHKLFRFMTLTLDPATAGEKTVKHIRATWAKFRVYLRREFGKSIKFICVMEFQKATGMPHLHVLVDRYIPQPWIKENWAAVGGGIHVDIRAVDMHRVSRYLSKYLTKELLMSAPKRSRRVTVSRGIVLNEKTKKTHKWRLIKMTITYLFRTFAEVITRSEYGVDEQLSGFVIPAPAVT